MSQPIPVLYVRTSRVPRAGWLARLTAVALAIACLAVLGTALTLQADPRGIGTHEQLGMQPCGFLRTTGLPCPTCGMTTAYTHFAHGRFFRSLITQPAGMILAVTTVWLFWASIYVGLAGKPIWTLLRILPTTRLLWIAFAVVLVAWAYKIFMVLSPHAASH